MCAPRCQFLEENVSSARFAIPFIIWLVSAPADPHGSNLNLAMLVCNILMRAIIMRYLLYRYMQVFGGKVEETCAKTSVLPANPHGSSNVHLATSGYEQVPIQYQALRAVPGAEH